MELIVENYSKKIKENEILKNVNYRFCGGKIYLVLGKNASGKTMFLRALCGLMKATTGSVILDGKELKKDFDFLPNAGVMIENPSFIKWYTGLDNLKLLASIRNVVSEEDIKQAMEMVGLKAEDKRKFSKYSLGMKQKLGIAQAIMEKPDILLLDEPTNALDDDSIEALKDILSGLKQQGKIVILATHDKEDLLSIADEVITFKGGAIVESN